MSPDASPSSDPRGHDPSADAPLALLHLGEHHVANPPPGQPGFLSAASGIAWSGTQLYCVGDDQASVAEFTLDPIAVLEALRAGKDTDLLESGVAARIIPEVLPEDPKERAARKADFEALALVRRRDVEGLSHPARDEILRRFPHGLLLMSGSGGKNHEGDRRSTCVAYSLDEAGHIVGLPSKISFRELHEELQRSRQVTGELNVEGMAVHGDALVLAQRGNSVDEDGDPAKNLLIHLDLGEVLESISTDLSVGALELREVREYDLGHLPVERDGETFRVKLDFTDLDSVAGDPERRLVVVAAGEGADGSPVEHVIAGSAVGIVSADGELVSLTPLADRSIKLEGVDARYNPSLGSIDLLLVSDADDPDVPAPLFAARLRAQP